MACKAQEEDRLSSLPDFILHRILSLLDDTREALKTSVLCKRWRHLWASVPDLSFDNGIHYFNSSFEESVRSVLQRRDHTSKVGRFRFYLGLDDEFDNIGDGGIAFRDYVIRYAIRHGVHHLIIHHFDSVDLLCISKVSSALIGCRTVKILELIGFDLSQYYHMFLQCTVTALHLKECQFYGHLDILEHFPNVTNLSLVEFSGYHGPCFLKISGSKLINLRIECQTCDLNSTVELSAPNLVYLNYNSHWYIDDFSVIHLPSLQHAELYVDSPLSHELEKLKELSPKLLKFLHGISNAEFLKVETLPFEVLSNVGMLENQTSSFSKLKSVVLQYYNLKELEQVKAFFLSGTLHPQSVHVELIRNEI